MFTNHTEHSRQNLNATRMDEQDSLNGEITVSVYSGMKLM